MKIRTLTIWMIFDRLTQAEQFSRYGAMKEIVKFWKFDL